MKTQLLEDIGQSGTLSPAPAKPIGHPTPAQEVHIPAPAGNAQAAKARPTPGVWRQKPATEPEVPEVPVAPAPQPEEAATVELDKVFEELAALEAQLMPSGQQHGHGHGHGHGQDADDAPVSAPMSPRQAPAAGPVEPQVASPQQPAEPQAGAAPAPHPPRQTAAPQEPLFDFTPPPERQFDFTPAPERQAAAAFASVPAAAARSRPRYLVLATGVLASALVIGGGSWLVQERKDAASLALVAGAASNGAPVDQAAPRPAPAAKAAATDADSAMRALPAVPDSRPAPAPPPPLVMLEPDPPAAAKSEKPAPTVTDEAETPAPPKPDATAANKPASPSPKQAGATARAPSRKPVAARPEKEKARREPARQLARASAAKAKPPALDTSMEATLKACRELGYHATQCIKRDCSVTQYGLVCRGR